MPDHPALEAASTRTFGFLVRESAEVYQAKAAEYLTSYRLADFRRCPLLYRKKNLGLVEDEDRPAFLVGRALHTLVLEGQQHLKQDCEGGCPERS